MPKYPRIFHIPTSPGVTRDDRINHDYWKHIKGKDLVITEKLDGGNTCLNKHGVFARSHAMPSRHPSMSHLKPIWASIRGDLGDYEIFGENLYAVHSIEYRNLDSYFYVFGVRRNGIWLSWLETKKVADKHGLPTVHSVDCYWPYQQDSFESLLKQWAMLPSLFGDEKEGAVIRLADSFPDSDFENSIFKWVRKNHVKTDETWSKNWKKAKLNS